jgi:hypothetical protein
MTAMLIALLATTFLSGWCLGRWRQSREEG